MATWNLGSIATAVQNRVDNIPSSISGAELINIADNQVQFAELYTGQSIGSTAIAATFQPALINLTVAELLNYMNTQGIDASAVKLGDLSITKGGESNIQKVSNDLRNMGMKMLQEHGREVRYGKAFG